MKENETMEAIQAALAHRTEHGWYDVSISSMQCPDCKATDLHSFERGNWNVTFGIECWTCDFEVSNKDTSRFDAWNRARQPAPKRDDRHKGFGPQ